MYEMIVVDDEAELREGISSYFPWESLNIHVVGVFENGRAALSYVKTHPVDIVLTDVRMPFMDGLELIERAKAVSPETCYVILSGFREFEYAKKGLLLGVKDYILKPTKYSQIFEVFSRITAELDNQGKGREDLTEQDGTAAVISSVKRYIRSCYAGATLEGAAEYVHLNPYYLSTFFKQHTGEKFSDYVIRVRMEVAASLLEKGDQTVKEVAEAVGYTNPSSFTRVFRQYYQCNPKDYRRRKQGI